MAKTIKYADGFKLTVDNEIFEFRDSDGNKTVGERWNECMDMINIPEDNDLRADLFRNLFAFGELDLSRAFEGHYVCIRFIPVGA